MGVRESAGRWRDFPRFEGVYSELETSRVSSRARVSSLGGVGVVSDEVRAEEHHRASEGCRNVLGGVVWTMEVAESRKSSLMEL